MLKNDVLRNVAGKLEGCSQKDVEADLTAYAEVVIETLQKDRQRKFLWLELETLLQSM